jgi:hypothetical protein
MLIGCGLVTIGPTREEALATTGPIREEALATTGPIREEALATTGPIMSAPAPLFARAWRGLVVRCGGRGLSSF